MSIMQSAESSVRGIIDPVEDSLGISTYLRSRSQEHSHHGFTAISKGRFSDFLVHEVGMDGSIACLTCMDPVIVETGNTKNDVPVPTDGNDVSIDIVNGVKNNTDSDEGNKRRKLESLLPSSSHVHDWAILESELSNFIQNDSAANDVIQFLQSPPTVDTSKPTEDLNLNQQQHYIVLPSLIQKEQRRAVHEWVKQRLSDIAVADTVEGGIIRIWHKVFRSNMPNKLDRDHSRDNQRQGKRNHLTNSTSALPPPPRDKPYLQFVMYKENMDTGLALQLISKRANSFGNSNRCKGSKGFNSSRRLRLGYAGNKDKRGITCQFLTIPARDTSIKHLCNVFNKQQQPNDNTIGSSVLGSGHTLTAGVGMIRLGNFTYSKNELRLGRLRGNRFQIALRNIILPAVDTLCCRSMLKDAVTHLKQHGFINYFGTQRFGKHHNTHMIGLALLRGDYRTAIDSIICPPQVDDPSIETEALNVPTNNNAAIRSAQIQWRDRFQAVSNSDETTEHRAIIEQDLARQTLSSMNHYMQSEISILQSLSRFPLDYEKAFFCITKTMRMMFIHAVQSLLWNKCASYRIDTLGQAVVVGDLVVAKLSESKPDMSIDDSNSDFGDGLPEVNVVTETDVINGRYGIDDVVLPLVGVKTQNPENMCGSYLDKLMVEFKISREMMLQIQQTHRDFHCQGDYRKLICRPMNVEYEIIEYSNEFQPLLQTDFMKLNGVDLPHRLNDYRCQLEQDGANVPIQSPTENNQALLGMVIGFTLPSSSYATICLRELMKRPTSSEYQRELDFGSTTMDSAEDDLTAG